jgi:16S rRNA C967 or C1407 C5-methylase (RsmB/RsmF family)/NOL1/NOP2/fmu family ribosome biogenesis protein
MMGLPSIFVREMRALLGGDYPAFAAALSGEAQVSIRLNPGKVETGRCPTDGMRPVAWCRDGRYVAVRPSFTADPLFHAGCYYVQEASSMFLEQVVRQHVTEPVVCLDLCAAPGGKSTHLSAMLPQGSMLVANEVIRSRAGVLSENVTKWGDPSTIVTRNDPAEIGRIASVFDVVLADVPCSGEGMFRKDRQAMASWSPAGVDLCAMRQQRIVADVWPALKPGGILIYSTCTFNVRENEQNIRWIMDRFGAEALTVDVRPEWGVAGCQDVDTRVVPVPVYRFFPHLAEGEGFFIAVVRKPQGRDVEAPVCSSQNKRTPSKDAFQPFSSTPVGHWIQSADRYLIEANNRSVVAFPCRYAELYRLLSSRLEVVSAGIRLAEIKGKDIVPCHALSMSVALNREAFPSYEVDKATALQYLSREAIYNLPPELPESYILLTYGGHPLGFVKNIGRRANNMYPQEWRIRNRNVIA